MSKVDCLPRFLCGGSLPVKPSTASTFVPMRVIVIQFAGADWPDCEGMAPGRCELWLRPGLISFRRHLGLTGASQLPFCVPLCLLLAEQIALREVAGGDDWQQGAEQTDTGRESEILSGKGSSLEVEYVLMLG